MKARTIILVATILLAAPFLRADAIYYPAASISAPATDLSSSPRALAMGGAGTALEGDLFSIDGNPAGLARLSGDLELSFQYGRLNPDTGLVQEEIVGGSRVGPMGVLALEGNYLNLGTYDYRDSEANLLGTTGLYNGDGTIAWANTFFGDRLSTGLDVTWIYQNLGGNQWVVPEGSLGLGWHLTDRVNLAASFTDFKLFYGTGDVNTALSAGGALVASDSLKILADFYYPFFDVSAVRAGFEWKPLPYFAFRAGWRQNLGGNDAELQNGPTAGIAATVKRIGVDYSFVSYGSGVSQRFALTVKFPERWIHESVVVIETSGGTAAAKALFDQGSSLQAKGNLVDALMAFKQCLQAAADFQDAQSHVDAIVKQLNLQGTTATNNKEVEAVFQHYVQVGLNYVKSGELKKAIDSFDFALELDKKNVQVVEKLKEVQTQLDILVAKHMEVAAAALGDANLDAAVKEFYEVLKLDPQNEGAKARLSTLRPKILQEIKRLHRKGIDAYVADQLDDAIEAWKMAMALDPTDPENVNRDLLKAEKLKDLRK